MEVSVWSGFMYGLTPEENVEAMRAAGLSCGELSTEDAEILLKRGDPTEAGRAFGDYARARGFRFPQGHLDLFSHVALAGEAELESLKRWLDLFVAVGVEKAVLHASLNGPTVPSAAARQRRVENLRVLTEYIRGKNICICLENLFPYPEEPGDVHPVCDTETAGQLLEIIEAVGSDQLGICLDTGHLNVSGVQSLGEFIRTAGDRLWALHIADNDGTSDQHLMPYSRGTVNWEEVLAALKEIDYRYLFNMEIPGESCHCPMELKPAKLRLAREVAEHMARKITG